MYTATTNLVAAAHEKDRISKDRTGTISTIVTSLQLAVFVGIIFGTCLATSSTFLIKALLGRKHDINLEVLDAAQKYVRIRALGMPAAVLIGVAQSACLGCKDPRSPLLVMIAAALVNFLGDMLFVGHRNSWLGGAAGAAWATVFSQYAAMIMFLRWLCSEPDAVRDNVNEMRAIPTRGILHNHFKFVDLFLFPKFMNIVKKIGEYMIPVTTTAIGRVSGYIAMSHVVSSAFGTADMAAQQIVLAFFLCFIPMCDSLNLTDQSFVPGIHEYT
jgi:Na+-driven multidrug efflux pump